ncbi:hypothetical protein EsH8_VI_001190 [Colletotrichum jinshuiense]
MDPRQPPQLPFSRNAASQYSRSPFPPSSNTTSNSTPNQSPFPPVSHPPPSNPAYAEHQRRSSDNHYYSSGPRPYPQESNSGPPPPSGHSRHPSASSLPPGPPLNRNMPPPASPPQPGNQQPPSHQMGHYGLPAPRAPPLSVGHPTSFPGGRELPSLGSISRTGSTGSSMSISSMLGGPPPVPRDSQPPPSHYHPPATSATSGPTFAPTMQASPRMHSASSEYQPFRRPQTPEHARPYDPRGSAAASPQGAYSTTPEMQRYGTPQQGYHQRGPSAQDGRESSRMPPGPPPRPTSQPKSYPNPPQRPVEMGRNNGPEEMYQRREEIPRGSMEYNPERPGLKPMTFDDRYRAERERREEIEFRERERRERAYSGGDGGRGHPAHQGEYRPQEVQRGQPPPFSRPPEPREQGPWPPRQPFDQSRVPYDPAGLHPRHHDFPPTSAPNYPNQSHPAPAPQYQQQPPTDRYPPANHPQQQPSAGQPGQPQQQPFDSPERQRINHLHPQAQPPPPHRRPVEEGPAPPSVAYNTAHGGPAYDSPRNRPAEEHPNNGQRNLLAVQEINRKGRVSPLPQAVQGAQPQLPGPAGEPGIKSEFGRMFSGIGSGVTGIGVASPVTTGAQLPYTNASLARRDETDSAAHDSGTDVAPKPPREGAKGRRRKLKEEDAKGDEENSGRLTPVGRAKRPKTHQHHHHQYVPVPVSTSSAANSDSHHHHHHHHGADQANPPPPIGITPFKNVKGSTPVPSPTGPAKDLPAAHHHHVPRSTHQHNHVKEAPAKQAVQSPTNVIPPKPKTIVTSKAVLESVTNLPRTHLGDVLYEPKLKPARQIPNVPSGRGFASTPTPLPWDMIKDKENCTLTVKVPKVYLTPAAREEITARRALWGTDVYTDDSDVIAACIHGGWIRGEWGDDVDVDMLDLDRGLSAPDKEIPANRRRKEKEREGKARLEANSATYLDKPPKTGPVSVPADRDMHVSLVILPRLEKYSSTTRFGLQSREYGGRYNGRKSVHDGISFMITSIRWVTNGAGTQNRLRGKGRRERMRKAMGEMNAASRGLNGAEFEREKQRLDKIRGEIVSGNWWKREEGRENDADKEERAPSEGDKENRPADETQDAARTTNGAATTNGVSPGKGDKMDVDGSAKSAEAPSA